MSVTVKLLTDTTTAQLTALREKLEPGRRQPLMTVLGVTVEKELKQWFRVADQQKPNRNGFKRSHFWAAIGHSTQFVSATDSTAMLTVSDPRFRTQLYGGTLKPAKSKYLAIPLVSAAYGITPRSGLIAGLFAYRTKRGSLLLGRKEGGHVVNYYKLVRSVTVRPDPSALPPPDLTSQALLTSARSFTLRQK